MRQFSLLIFIAYSISLGAQSTAVNGTDSTSQVKKPTIFQYLQQDSLLTLHISTDVKELNAYEDKLQPHPGLLQLNHSKVGHLEWQIKLEQRGKLRRSICRYKPLKLKFSEKELANKQLHSINLKSLKLVTNCHGGAKGDLLVLREYLAYRIYNLLTDKSFQVQLVYSIFEGKEQNQAYQSYGFLLEPALEMAARNNLGFSEAAGKGLDDVSEKDYLLMSIFQYLIGNTDWKLDVPHNLIFLKTPGHPQVATVPFDFDFSGLVKAPYAMPSKNLPIKTVLERLFMGDYKNDKVLQEVVGLFQERKSDIQSLVLNFEYLELKERERIWNYLSSFFIYIQKPNMVKSMFPSGTTFQDLIILDVKKVKE